jgi:hypothetical protein
MTGRVPAAEIAGVPAQDRCAWGAVCAEALTRLYSPYLQRKFDTDTAFTIVWGYITNAKFDLAAAKRYIRKCSRLSNSGEAYDYGLPNGMLASLVAELLYPTGASVVECVGFCARQYPQILFFRHGIDDRMIKSKHVYALMAEYNRFSRTVYNFVTHNAGPHRRDDYSARFVLDPNKFTLPRDLYASKPSPKGRQQPAVPEHEVIR